MENLTTRRYLENELKIITRPMPLAQLRVASRLAASFGHEWGGLGITEPMSIDDIERVVINPDREYIGSPIFAPSLDDRGNIVHETGTGRLQWEIASNGDVDFEVHRPEIGAVLAAQVFESGGGGHTVYVRLCAEEGDVCFRHVAILFQAIEAVAGDREAFNALSHLQCADEKQLKAFYCSTCKKHVYSHQCYDDHDGYECPSCGEHLLTEDEQGRPVID